jgi:hypothetical protein
MIIIDDFLLPDHQEKIKNTLYGREFPWYFIQDVSMNGNPQNRWAASHWFVSNNETLSHYRSLIEPIAALGAMRAGYQLNSIYNARTFLQYPLNPTVLGTNEIDKFHVDMPDKKHLVVLYYVNDSDGDTVIIDKQHLTSAGNSDDNVRLEDYNIVKRITPKQGRAVLFDGWQYHTAEQPQNHMRCVINLNII